MSVIDIPTFHRDNQQSLFNVFGATYTAVFFCGVNNCASVLPYVSTERVVLYRERFAGMYTSWSLCTCSGTKLNDIPQDMQFFVTCMLIQATVLLIDADYFRDSL